MMEEGWRGTVIDVVQPNLKECGKNMTRMLTFLFLG